MQGYSFNFSGTNNARHEFGTVFIVNFMWPLANVPSAIRAPNNLIIRCKRIYKSTWRSRKKWENPKPKSITYKQRSDIVRTINESDYTVVKKINSNGSRIPRGKFQIAKV